MSCCGTTRETGGPKQPLMEGPPPALGPAGTVDTQPSPSPGLGQAAAAFVPPTVTQPPAVHALNSEYYIDSGPPEYNAESSQWDVDHASTPPRSPSAYAYPPLQTSVSASAPLSPNRSAFGPSSGLNNPTYASHISRPTSVRGSVIAVAPASTYRQSTNFGLSSPPGAFISLRDRKTPHIPVPPSLPTLEGGKLLVAIDFGTTFSGIAYASSAIAGGTIQQIHKWPGSNDIHPKIPTCLLYEQGNVLAWGLEARKAGSTMEGTTTCEWFKLFLSPQTLRAQGLLDPRLPSLPPNKEPIDLITDFLACLWEYAKDYIINQAGGDLPGLGSAEVWLTIPASWDAEGRHLMHTAALRAHLVHPTGPEDQDWQNRLKLVITEPEAAAVYCAHNQLTSLYKLRSSQTFVIVDAGGGTVDIAAYCILGEVHHLEIGEVSARSGSECGSVFLDWHFLELLRRVLERDHQVRLGSASLANALQTFQEEKLSYGGVADDNKTFQYTCEPAEDPEDASLDLGTDGELSVSISGETLRKEVFDPVVEKVLDLIEHQLNALDRVVDGLIVVGGFAKNDYLFSRLKNHFSSRIALIERPLQIDIEGPESATLRGAISFAISEHKGVAHAAVTIAPRSYVMKVKLPAEPVDTQMRPAYISQNSAGIAVCENRLQYLIVKGAIMRKGQRVITKFCKFSTSVRDCHFPAVLYVSDSDKSHRYSDEASTTELCKWQVDLASLPTFGQNALAMQTPPANGFYTEFELGVELDCAEVRGILLSEGHEYGRVVFEYLN